MSKYVKFKLLKFSDMLQETLMDNLASWTDYMKEYVHVTFVLLKSFDIFMVIYEPCIWFKWPHFFWTSESMLKETPKIYGRTLSDWI